MAAKSATLFAIIGYGTCSSLMLIMNKVAVNLLPAPSFVLLLQFFCSWFAVKVCGLGGCVVVDKLERKKLLAFLPVSLAFLAAVFANIKTLQFANVETFIVFRASTPLTISICEWLCLGRELPGLLEVLDPSRSRERSLLPQAVNPSSSFVITKIKKLDCMKSTPSPMGPWTSKSSSVTSS